MAFVLGLTGNIACGKSSVGQLLTERFGAEYLDADRVVHARYAPGTPETAAIAARFGADLLREDGTIDRRRLGDLVMSDRAALLELEGILNPGVRRVIDDRLANTTAPVIVLDAIRLIEAGLVDRCDAVWVVVCDAAQQSARLQSARNLTPEQAELRISAQRPVDEKLRHATAVINNNTTLDDVSHQVTEAWARTVAPRLKSKA